jgi:magnesium transporter
MGGGGEAGVELSMDNMKGIVLALLSSGFTGASFILMKKGLHHTVVASGIHVGRAPPHPSHIYCRLW